MIESVEFSEAKKNFNRLYRVLDGFLATASYNGKIIACLDIDGPNIVEEIPDEFVGFQVKIRYYNAEFIVDLLEKKEDEIFVGLPIESKRIRLKKPIPVDMSSVQRYILS